ncbi:unnamed protein product [Durusdinium trenchii]|uniref:Uncharacterized protein n=1 Tax=Durusdinium trenchii TaxID=1381693 RepID=A0ABP0IJE8_9DINO
MAKRCEVWVRSFCQCSGLCACMAALCCAVAASIFIYVAGDGAGNGPAPAAVAYKCTSDLYFGRVLKPEQKGLAIDDTTFHECGHAIPRMWPNTQAPLTSLRLFKAWDKAWPDGGRVEAWSQLEVVVREGQMQVLVGTQVTCDEQDDDRDWRLVKQLVQVLGRQHVMGIAVGNELELLQFKENVSTECIQRMWKGGYFLRKLSERAADLDHLDGFDNVPLTSVFGGYILSGSPFVETPGAMVQTFLREALKMCATSRHQWVFALNIYPYFATNNVLDPGTTDQCTGSLQSDLCFSKGCNLPSTIQLMRQKMSLLVGSTDSLLWIGETGWSSPQTWRALITFSTLLPETLVTLELANTLALWQTATPRSASFSQIAPRNCLYRWKVVHKNS